MYAETEIDRRNIAHLDIYVSPKRRRPTVRDVEAFRVVSGMGVDDFETVESPLRRFVFLDRSRSLGGTNVVMEIDGTIYVMTDRTRDEMHCRWAVLHRLDAFFAGRTPTREEVVRRTMLDAELRRFGVSADCSLGDLVAWRKFRGSFANWIGKRFAKSRQPHA